MKNRCKYSVATFVMVVAIFLLMGCGNANENVTETKETESASEIVTEDMDTETAAAEEENSEKLNTEALDTEVLEEDSSENDGSETGNSKSENSSNGNLGSGNSKNESSAAGNSGSGNSKNESSTTGNSGSAGNGTSTEPYYDKTMAQAIWGYVNAERTAAGLSEISWDENVYSFACQRAQAIIADFSHNGCGGYGENILYCSAPASAYDLHMLWYNSQGHHDNYMRANYTGGACAVYYSNGIYYAVENFYGSSSPVYDTREINGQTINVTKEQAEAIDTGHYWIASNGAVVFYTSPYDYGCYAATEAEVDAAMEEFISCHSAPFY